MFLREVALHFEIVVFTASLGLYARPLLKRLVPSNDVIDFILFREHCTSVSNTDGNNLLVKDLGCLGRDLKDVIIVDNSPAAYLYHPENALPSISWYSDKNDVELMQFIPVLKKMAYMQEDVRDVLTNFVEDN